MKILAFDTSSSACSVALQHGDEIKSVHEIAPMQQAKLILPCIQRLLSESFLSFNQLDAVAYGCGPGSFTGMRIANSVAQGIAFAANIPLIPVSSLATLAQTAFMEQGEKKCLVALDARMNQVYWAVYQVNQQGYVELISEETVSAPNEIKIANYLKASDWYGVGDGWKSYAEQISTSLSFSPRLINAEQLPHAVSLLTLAQIKLKAGDWVKANQAISTYLR